MLEFWFYIVNLIFISILDLYLLLVLTRSTARSILFISGISTDTYLPPNLLRDPKAVGLGHTFDPRYLLNLFIRLPERT